MAWVGMIKARRLMRSSTQRMSACHPRVSPSNHICCAAVLHHISRQAFSELQARNNSKRSFLIQDLSGVTINPFRVDKGTSRELNHEKVWKGREGGG